MLNAFEKIAKDEGVLTITTIDTSEFRLFRKNIENLAVNPKLRSIFLSTLSTGTPTSYYHQRGFEIDFDDEEEENELKSSVESMLKFTLGDYIKSARTINLYSDSRWNGVVKFMDNKGTHTEFYKLFRELHASAEGGDTEDRQFLIDIIEGLDWSSVSGYDVLNDCQLMIKNL
jgi:hypothetical protein